MPANTSLDLISLDFDTQKTALINFLQTQSEFKDYDFTGSNLNVLIDLLTYNTFKNSFYLNMALSEGFIDSAQLRPSILSHAKELNYLPRSARSAKANITVSFQATGDHAPYLIQQGQTFTASMKNNSFIFSIPNIITVASPNTSYSFTTDIFEGAYLKESFIFDTTIDLPLRFKLSNPNIDIDSLSINVFENQFTIGTLYNRAISLLGLNDLSQVYFVQTSPTDGNYEFLFGDGIVGYQPKNGSLVVADYRVSSGSPPNGASRFSINFDPTNPFSELIGNVSLVVNTNAIGGAPIEDMETTRFYAPRWFQTQERAVVPTDYQVLMKTQFPEIQAINVYGGEQLIPPQFGKVVIVVNFSNIQGLPQTKLDQYTNFLQARMPMAMIPIFVQPTFTYLDITSTINYNINISAQTPSTIKTTVLNAISAFNDDNLNTFNATFRFSKFTTVIDNADPSIISNLTNIVVCKKFFPVLGSPQPFTTNFSMNLVNDLPPMIYPHNSGEGTTLTSSFFTLNGDTVSLEDDNTGNINIVKQNQGVTTLVKKGIGSVNYDTGVVIIPNFQLDQFDGANFRIYVIPRTDDVACNLNTILLIDMNAIVVKITQVRQ
ncbi:MAG TPA: hypothetical protein VEP90_21725 [Methylomirabilota bacterium]|nr:hypothetical protein [Methylomirabilota bacterium]